ncbi:hypothetical protein XENOCAPTIV_003852, partial [Xenoophorus captivus]
LCNLTLELKFLCVETFTMDLTVVKEAGKTVRASKGASNTARAFSPSFSASSWGLSGHVGMRVLMHRDMITCRFYRSLPQSWLKKYWGQFGKDSNKSSYSPLRWSSSPFSLSSPRLSTCSSNIQPYFLRSPVSRLSFPALKDRDREKDQAGTAASQAADGHRGFPSVPGMTISSFGPSTHLSASFNSSFGTSLRHHSSSGSLPGDMDETDALRSKRCNDDAISLAPSIAESIIVEDSHYAAVRADLESDAQDLEADSWSLAVDQQYLKKHSKDVVKRQDVIYGGCEFTSYVEACKCSVRDKTPVMFSDNRLRVTEMHHVRTLKIMLRVYVREMKENLQMDSGRLDCEIGERMKDCYGDFCSHHTEAVSFYKEMLQNNRRFQNLIKGRRRLLHEGTVSWKAASGRLKDILAVLLSDVLLLLQEKDQRYVFATDNKPSVISLQKLIVREVAHEEKAMFLICASSSEPEMYEIHTTSKEERNTWMTQIRQAVESEEEEAQASRLREFQERLGQMDAVIAKALTEKLQLFTEIAESVAGLEDAASRSKLLLRGDASDLQQGETLLKGAITEELLLSCKMEPHLAIVSQQDSQIELQRASLTERVSLPGRHRGNVLLEQEKQRTLALQREELAYLNKLQSKHRQEQQRWEKERERHRQQVEATDARLRQREEECRKLEVQVHHAALKILSRFKQG